MGFALIISMMIATSGVISGFSAEIFGITKKAGDSPSIFIQASNPIDGLPAELLDLISHTNIEQILPIAEKRVKISSINTSIYTSVIGVNISKLMLYYSKAEIYAGRRPESNDSLIECLVGKDLHPLVSSSKINLTDDSNETNTQVHVVGFVQNINEFQNVILVEMKDYSTIFNKTSSNNAYQRIKIKLKNSYFIDETIADLKVILRDYIQTLSIKPEQQAEIFTESLFSDIMRQLSLLFGVLFIIALIRIFHAISWFVRKYERDLLIMRATGLSVLQIIFLVILLAEMIGNIGFIMGMIFGFLIPSLIFTILSVFFIGGFLIPEFDIHTIFLLFFFSNLISVVAALYPAVVIARKKPSALSMSTHGIDK